MQGGINTQGAPYHATATPAVEPSTPSPPQVEAPETPAMQREVARIGSVPIHFSDVVMAALTIQALALSTQVLLEVTG